MFNLKLKEKADIVSEILLNEYKNAKCSLDFNTPLELLIATRLSAQCTDERVNIVTKDLFSKYKAVEEYAQADMSDIEKTIHSCGFFRAKSKSIVELSKKIKDEFNSKVPDTMESLLSLPGVGRKTANLILGELYNKPAIVADTHCIRLSNRIGFCKTDDPYKVELALKKLIKPESSLQFCHCLVNHGRSVCNARKPECGKCVISDYCKFNKEINK